MKKISNFKQNKQNFSRLHALCGKKFWKFDLDLLKMPNFSKKCLFFSKKSPETKLQGFYCVFAWQYFQISSQISKNFFFRSKNLDNLRGFLDPRQIFQENQGFNAFLCGNIFQIFAISVIFSSNFLSDIVIVALTWLKKGPKKES